MCVPMAKDLLGWTDRDISFFYSAAGVVVSCALHARIDDCVITTDYCGIWACDFVQPYC